MGVSIGRTTAPLLVAVSIGVAVVACGDESTPSAGEIRPTLTLIPELETPRPTTLVDSPGTGLVLDPDLVSLTDEIISSDPNVARLTKGNPVIVSPTGGVYAGRDPETDKLLLVGTVAIVTLTLPVSHQEIQLPSATPRSNSYALWPDELQTRYEYFIHSTNTYHLEGVTTFRATVDFYTGEVIGISFEVTSRDEVAEVIAPTFVPRSLADLALTQDRSDLAREIVDRDERLAKLLDSAYVTVYGNQPDENRFGIVQARWDGSVTVAGEYPVFIDRDYETLDYRSAIVALNKTNTGVLTIHVDLDREEIISVEPREGD